MQNLVLMNILNAYEAESSFPEHIITAVIILEILVRFLQSTCREAHFQVKIRGKLSRLLKYIPE